MDDRAALIRESAELVRDALIRELAECEGLASDRDGDVYCVFCSASLFGSWRRDPEPHEEDCLKIRAQRFIASVSPLPEPRP